MSLINQGPPEMPYTYQEYPKWIASVVVANADEEAVAVAEANALLGTDTPADREALILLAAEKGVKIDSRWSDDKIRAAIEAI